MKYREFTGQRAATRIDSTAGGALETLGLSKGVVRQMVYQAWDNASGAGEFTLDTFFRDGTLYVRLASAVVRSRLLLSADDIMARINMEVSCNALYRTISEDSTPVKSIVLQ